MVATAGLASLIFALARTGRAALSAAAVGAYIGAAYWFTSSTSFANPAVTIGRMFSDTFAGIAPGSVPLFVGAQVIGGGVGLALVKLLFPDASAAAGRAVVSLNPVTTRHRTRPHNRNRHREELIPMSRSFKPSVLFVCVHNAGRSQMAAGS